MNCTLLMSMNIRDMIYSQDTKKEIKQNIKVLVAEIQYFNVRHLLHRLDLSAQKEVLEYT